jgi:hypothetical protein
MTAPIRAKIRCIASIEGAPNPRVFLLGFPIWGSKGTDTYVPRLN